MRKLKDYEDESAAQALCDALELEGIEAQVRQGRDGPSVWVIHDDDRERAREFESSFAPADVEELKKKADAQREKKKQEAKPVYAPKVGRQVVVQASFGIGVILLVAVSGLAFLRSMMEDAPLEGLYILRPYEYPFRWYYWNWAEPWRAVLPIFQHFGFFHILFNMMWLLQLGGQVETHHGTARFLALVVVVAAFSNVAQLLLFGPNFGGMSGVNYGLFGFCWMQMRYDPQGGVPALPGYDELAHDLVGALRHRHPRARSQCRSRIRVDRRTAPWRARVSTLPSDLQSEDQFRKGQLGGSPSQRQGALSPTLRGAVPAWLVPGGVSPRRRLGLLVAIWLRGQGAGHPTHFDF